VDPGGGEVLAFEAIIDLLVEQMRRIPQGDSRTSQPRGYLVLALGGGDGRHPREPLVGAVGEGVLDAQPKLTAKRVAGTIGVA
jgi:hypothetical protein